MNDDTLYGTQPIMTPKNIDDLVSQRMAQGLKMMLEKIIVLIQD